MAELSAELYEQMGEAEGLDLSACTVPASPRGRQVAQAGATIRRNLEALGYGE